jgi:shikimate kinase
MSCLAWLADLELRGAKILVAGAPCSGKTTFAKAHALAGDEILDYDVVHAELTNLELYVHDESQISRSVSEFGRRARAMRQGWIIATAPSIDRRRALRKSLQARSIVLEIWPGECLARLERSDRPDAAKMRLRSAITEWWERYHADVEAYSWGWLGLPHETALNEYDLLHGAGAPRPTSASDPTPSPRPSSERSGRAPRRMGSETRDDWVTSIAPPIPDWSRREW